MSLIDRTNETIPLAIGAADLTVDVDADSSVWPEPWVFLEDSRDGGDAIYLTYAEAAKLHDRLGRILGPPTKKEQSPMSTTTPTSARARDHILAPATELIAGERAADYGDATENFTRIGVLWGVILNPDTNAPIPPETVGLLLGALKMARLVTSPGHLDSWRDLAGYAGLGGAIGTIKKAAEFKTLWAGGIVPPAPVIDPDAFRRTRGI